MPSSFRFIEKATHKISLPEFKGLLTRLHQQPDDVALRIRLMGGMWFKNFMRILSLTSSSITPEKDFFDGVIFNDLIENKIIIIQNLTQIMQFELDSPYQEFQPYFHYTVSPFDDLTEISS